MNRILFSNRFETLLDALLDGLDGGTDPPLEAREVIVPSAAIQRRIALAVADRRGVCANIRFSFLAQWLWRQIGRVVPVAENSPFTASVLTWRVLDIVGDRDFVAAHPRLAAYLASADDVMRHELAGRTAALLEQYLTYRQDWLARWLAGGTLPARELAPEHAEDERWQAALWRRIARDLGAEGRHPSSAFFDAMDALGAEAATRAGLPSRAHLFCQPSTPPLYLDMLKRLGERMDLRHYVLNPCREYWLAIVPPKRLAYLEAAGQAAHHETGNRLLAAWGRQSQAHIDLLFERDVAGGDEEAIFVPSGGASLLSRLQDAVLAMEEIPPGSAAQAPRNIEFHACHSLTRELEVLHDRLLALFAGEHPPRPCDILVVTPDLASAAPLIDAVFGNAPPERSIPYAITGRPPAAMNGCAQVILETLRLATSRFRASEVFGLLQRPLVARGFGVSLAQLEAIHGWIREAGIRWGVDGGHRGKLGLPSVGHHSFQDGIDRLFLGYALPADASEPLQHRLPAGDAEGSLALALGIFHDFLRRLAWLRAALDRPKRPAEWRDLLLEVLDHFTAPEGEEIDDAGDARAAIVSLHDCMAAGGFDDSLGVDVVRVALQSALDDPARGGVPGGRVTFAAMASLRNLPYGVVCAVGMNDGAFPSVPRPAEFDLLAAAPRRGDRQRRDDDRNVFLDLLLAARDHLHLSYTGRSVRDNASLPPSVLVAELLDVLSRAIAPDPTDAGTVATVRAGLVVNHPLQAFSVDYFADAGSGLPRSFNADYCRALEAQLAARPSAAVAPSPAPEEEDVDTAWQPQAPFFAQPLADPGPEYRDVTLDRLAGFFANPASQLLRGRLGITMAEAAEALEDDEPFEPDFGSRNRLAKRLVPVALRGASSEALFALARAGNEYPAGSIGDLQLREEVRQLEAFAGSLRAALEQPALAPVQSTLAFALGGEGWQLTGGFGDLRPGGLVRHRYDDTRARDYLDAWIRHLFLNALAPAGVAPFTTVHARDGSFRLRPVDDAPAALADLLGLYREGLSAPLHFYPKAAWAYVIAGDDLAAARRTWSATPWNAFAEQSNPAWALALRGCEDPLDADFERCATTVFTPLLAALDDERIVPRKDAP